MEHFTIIYIFLFIMKNLFKLWNIIIYYFNKIYFSHIFQVNKIFFILYVLFIKNVLPIIFNEKKMWLIKNKKKYNLRN